MQISSAKRVRRIVLSGFVAWLGLFAAPPSFAEEEQAESVHVDADLEWRTISAPASRLEIIESRLSHDWKLGPLTPSIDVRSWRGGFEDAPALVDDLRSQASVSMTFALPNLPMLSVSAAREQRTLMSSAWLGKVSDAGTNTANAMLWYGLGAWEVSAGSGYTQVADPLRGVLDWSTVEHSATVTYRPIDSLALSLAGKLQQVRYSAGSDWLNSSSVTASAYYTNYRHNITAFVWGSLIENQDSYGASASRNYDLAVQISKELRTGWLPIGGTHSIGIEYAMSHYQDMLYSAYSSGASIGRLTYRIEH
jgi:hypothetical protein